MKKKVCIVSHTHWDREWYLPLEQFKVKLVDMVDRLLDILDRDARYSSFLLDGQSVLLEDYLEIKPQNRERIAAYIRSGRIQAGPWYVLPDELLISGESHIRNYLMGQAVCDPLGGSQRIGYLPDSFGHPAQMPQILKGLGLSSFFFWRGMTPDVPHSEFLWRSPDGSEILAVFMPCGYGNMARLSVDRAESVPRVQSMVETLSTFSLAPVLLFMNGSDHIFPQADLPQAVASLNEACCDAEFSHTTLTDYLQELTPALPGLAGFSGELRATRHSLLLGGTASTRMYLKQHNHHVQNNMEKYLEPLAALHKAFGQDYPADIFRHLWRQILRNHPHDSICGCSVDAVHDEMESRYAAIRNLQAYLLDKVFNQMADAVKKNASGDACVVLFNPAPQPYSGYLEIDVDFDRTLIVEVDFATSKLISYEGRTQMPPLPSGIAVRTCDGASIPAVILHAQNETFLKYSDDTLPESYRVNRCRVGLLVRDLAPLGYTVLYGSRTQTPSPTVTTQAGASISNDFFTLEANPDGTLKITDRAGHVWDGQHRFHDGGDAGDEYSYSYPAQDAFHGLDARSIRVEKTVCPDFWERLTLSGQLLLPQSLTRDRKARDENLVACPVSVQATLYAGTARVDFHTTVDNRADDHLLQVVFPLPVAVKESHAQGTFHVMARPVLPMETSFAHEQTPTFHPFHGFVSIGGDKTGLAVSSQGLPDYRVLEEEGGSALALTLLRCVGWLSRSDLLTRHGNGGWDLATPGAQCRGLHHFDYSLIPHRGSWQTANVLPLSAQYNTPPIARQSHSANGGTLPESFSLLAKLPGHIQLSALKQTEKGDGLLLRLVNLSDEPFTGELTFGLPVSALFQTNLAEEEPHALSLCGNACTVSFRPWEILSLLLVPGTGGSTP